MLLQVTLNYPNGIFNPYTVYIYPKVHIYILYLLKKFQWNSKQKQPDALKEK